MARGPAQDDAKLFAADALPALRQAVVELVWLLDRGYVESSALALVGNRHQLRGPPAHGRVPLRVHRRPGRASPGAGGRRLGLAELAGRPLAIDGFNVLIAWILDSADAHVDLAAAAIAACCPDAWLLDLGS